MKIEIVDLRVEAAAEVRRLASARRFAVNGDGWRARADRRGRHVDCGRSPKRDRGAPSDHGCSSSGASGSKTPAARSSSLVSCPWPLNFHTAVCGRQRRRRIEAIVQELEPQIRAQVDAAASDWRQAVESVAGSFTSARTARERAIAIRPAAPGADAFQPGLFDRRAERGAGAARGGRGRRRVRGGRSPCGVRAVQRDRLHGRRSCCWYSLRRAPLRSVTKKCVTAETAERAWSTSSP